jgi:hypothetical protein
MIEIVNQLLANKGRTCLTIKMPNPEHNLFSHVFTKSRTQPNTKITNKELPFYELPKNHQHH